MICFFGLFYADKFNLKKWVVFQRVGNEKRYLKWENGKDIYLKNLKLKKFKFFTSCIEAKKIVTYY